MHRCLFFFFFKREAGIGVVAGTGFEACPLPFSPPRLFCAETGMTLKTYVTRVRVEAARKLLRETGDKLEAVASLVGFHDASHLSRLFVKYLSGRPGDVRRTG